MEPKQKTVILVVKRAEIKLKTKEEVVDVVLVLELLLDLRKLYVKGARLYHEFASTQTTTD